MSALREAAVALSKRVWEMGQRLNDGIDPPPIASDLFSISTQIAALAQPEDRGAESALAEAREEVERLTREMEKRVEDALRLGMQRVVADLSAAREEAERLRDALRDTRWWGERDDTSTWCWCDPDLLPCTDHGCAAARAALSGGKP